MLVRRDGWTRWVAAGGYLARSGSRPRVSPGDEVHVYRPRDSVDAANGFYFSFGETVQGDHDASDVIRDYIATTAAGAVRATDSLSTRLNRLRVPFSMKSLDRPEAYWRADATVLYVPWWNLRLVLHEVEAFRIAAPDDVRDVTPLFTRRVAPGVAVAEDPADGSSF
ncbi:MAG: hypothetical protein IT459_22360, partial [Planctomycetes bacterium]|nr:hypothetical protein [Planctomycetota bacterium]